MTTLEVVHGRYPAEDVDRSLLAIAVAGGNTERAQAALKADGITVSSRTLREWRNDRYPRRYAHIQDQYSNELETVMIRQARDAAIFAAEVERVALEQTLTDLREGKIRDPAGTARNLGVTKGINIDQMLKLTGRDAPTIAERSAEEILKSLAGKLGRMPETVVEAQVVEVTPTNSDP